ncbi:MAG: hypothetical protein CMM16_05335 [Rhodospirillaceae bacterium]|nr:hypothetical protein [Rhodospirillaceae bacterium]
MSQTQKTPCPFNSIGGMEVCFTLQSRRNIDGYTVKRKENKVWLEAARDAGKIPGHQEILRNYGFTAITL